MKQSMVRHSLLALCCLFFVLAATATRASTAGAGSAPTPAATDAGADFNLRAASVGLNKLSSYQAAVTLTFKGTRQGQAGNWSRTITMLAVQQPAARQVTVTNTGDTSPAVAAWEVNGALYEQQGKNTCAASAVEKGHSLSETWEPARFIPGVASAQMVGSETVNGQQATHYRFDEHAAGADKSAGDVWIAPTGGYVVKYVLSSTGGAAYFGAGSEGTATWDYELTQVNQPLSITIPGGCPTAMLDAPTLPDAADVVKIPGLLSYTTASSVADTASFYQKQLPAQGWEIWSPADAADTSTALYYVKGSQQLAIIIAPGEGSTAVQITLISVAQGAGAPAIAPTRSAGGPKPPTRPTLPALPGLPGVPPKLPTLPKP